MMLVRFKQGEFEPTWNAHDSKNYYTSGKKNNVISEGDMKTVISLPNSEDHAHVIVWITSMFFERQLSSTHAAVCSYIPHITSHSSDSIEKILWIILLLDS